jgi:hypothetical protein
MMYTSMYVYLKSTCIHMKMSVIINVYINFCINCINLKGFRAEQVETKKKEDYSAFI